jgi:hypothetical protein
MHLWFPLNLMTLPIGVKCRGHEIFLKGRSVSVPASLSLGARFPPPAYPGAGLLAIVRKIIFQWHSELRPLGKKCCAGVLEVMGESPYLCTTPQGRDGGNATEMGGRTGGTAGGTLPAREAEKGPRKLFQNKFCGFEKSSYLCSPNQGKRRWARRPEPTEMTV